MLRFIMVFFIMCFGQTVAAQGDYLSIGIGPSMLYSDNSGQYRDLRFKIEPSITLSINKQINEFVGLRGSIGAQIFNSGDYSRSNPKKVIKWGNQNVAFDFNGTGYFVDLMPTFTTNPNAAGMLMSTIQFYSGLGFGVMFVEREQETLINVEFEDGLSTGGQYVTSNETGFIPYLPLRIGLSSNLSGDWDFALEFVLITTTNSELDGNDIKNKLITPDMSGQIQFKVKWYFGPSW